MSGVSTNELSIVRDRPFFFSAERALRKIANVSHGHNRWVGPNDWNTHQRTTTEDHSMKTIQRRLLASILCTLLLGSPFHTRAADPLISFFDVWVYLDNGVDQGTAWQQPGFDDHLWNFDLAEFGFGDGDETTLLNPSINTAYFRNYFGVANPGTYSNITLRVKRDDGAIVYLNGIEVFRNNMPSGAVNYATKATRNLVGAEETVLAQRVVPASVLVSGVNSIAVEIHQATGGSDDMSFDMELIGHRVGENQPPSAYPSFVTVEQDTPKGLVLNAVDPDSNPLTYTNVSGPVHGVLSGVAPNLTYTPNPGYLGPDLFSFSATDGQWQTEIAEVGIEVVPASNHPPVADAQSVTVNEDNTLTIVLTATDPDGDTLAYSFTQTTHGTLAAAPGHSVVYQPATNYFGPDSFTFMVDDGNGGVASAKIDITVLSVNDAPVANAQSVTTAEDTALGITVSASDIEGDTLSYSYTQPAHGTVTGTGSSVIYLPAANYTGPDNFTFTVDDGNGGSAAATVNIEVTTVNDAPVALAREASASDPTNFTRNLVIVATNSQSVLVLLDGSLSSDVDGNGLTYAWYRGAETTPFSTAMNLTMSFPIGSYVLTLVVSDGNISVSDSITLQVFTPCDLVKTLVTQVQSAALNPSARNGLLGHLNAACASFGEGNIAAGVHQLELFQDRVNNKIAPTDPTLAASLNAEAQRIINEVNGQ